MHEPLAPRAPDLAVRLADLGTVQVVEGNTPVLLDDPESAWLVRVGRVEVFSMEMVDGAPRGARAHFLSAGPDELLLGVAPDGYGTERGLVAVGGVGTELIRLPLRALRAWADDPASLPRVAGLVDGWVRKVCAATASGLTARSDLTIGAGERVALETGKSARARSGVVWVRQLSGMTLFIDLEDLPSDPEGGALFPLTRDVWLHALDAAEVEAVDTLTALREAAGWEGLALFHATAIRCDAVNRRLVAADHLVRLQQRFAREAHLRGSALADLLSVVRGPDDAGPRAAVDDPLLAACQAVGRALGMEMRGPAERRDAGAGRPPLDEILRASRVRARLVRLTGDWWRHDSGPLLGYLRERDRPVALIPTSPTAYRLVDPIAGTEEPVTAETAGRLATAAHTFYRRFPDHPVGLRDILRHGFRSAGLDLGRIAWLGLANALLALLVPVLTGVLFNTVIPSADRSHLLGVSATLILAALAVAVLGGVQAVAVLRIEGKMESSIQPAVWDRLLGLPMSFFRGFTAGELAMRAQGLSQIRQLLFGPTLTALLGGIFSVTSLALLYVYSVPLALLATALLAVVGGTLAGLIALQLRYQRRLNDADVRISGLVLQLVAAITKIRIAGAETHAFALWAAAFAEKKRHWLRAQGAGNALLSFQAAAPVVLTLILFGATRALEPQIRPGDFLAFMAAFGQLVVVLAGMGAAATSALATVPLYEAARPILRTLPEVDEERSDPGELTGRIEVSHLVYRYHPESPRVVDDVTIEIEAGEFVALVGQSGSGKSTLVRLLLGFDSPESGSIYYDDQDLTGLDVRAVRRQIGVVPQNARLMPGSIRDNILGSGLLTLDDAWAAAELAGIREEIERMPMGMGTLVSEGGSNLSGGQRQRLMIARALVHRPRVLLFDEATSALDNRTQAIVSESLSRLHVTRIVIAHRLSTIVAADRIYVLHAGRVVQQGAYQELMADREGAFAKLASRQMG